MAPELEYIRREAQRLTRDFTPDDWLRAPEGKWNASLLFEHLLLSYTATTKGLLKTMERGRPFCRKQTWRDRVATFYVVQLGGFVNGRTAPRNTVPRDGLGEDALQQFSDALVAMDATLNDAERRFGSNTKLLDHPVLGPLTAREWRRFHRVHAKHHFRQIVRHALK